MELEVASYENTRAGVGEAGTDFGSEKDPLDDTPLTEEELKEALGE